MSVLIYRITQPADIQDAKLSAIKYGMTEPTIT